MIEINKTTSRHSRPLAAQLRPLATKWRPKRQGRAEFQAQKNQLKAGFLKWWVV